uniref:Uncharacterized protein n=1 Tax=Anguilla anguilla TaxID=7936 RepID=A0A0E9PDB1_ANGAN
MHCSNSEGMQSSCFHLNSIQCTEKYPQLFNIESSCLRL